VTRSLGVDGGWAKTGVYWHGKWVPCSEFLF
jgi:hypothetical protein